MKKYFNVKLLLIISLFLCAISAIITFKSFQQREDARNLVDRTHEVIKETLFINTLLKKAEANQNAYLLSNDSTYLQKISIDSKLAIEHCDILESKVKINFVHANLVNNKILPLAKQKIQSINQTIIFFKTADGKAEVPLNGSSDKTLDSLQEYINSFIDKEQTLLSDRSANLSSINNFIEFFLYTSSVLIALTIVLSFYTIQKTQRHNFNLNSTLQTKVEEQTKELLIKNKDLNENVKELQTSEEEIRASLDHITSLQVYLEESEKKYRLISENSQDFIALHKPDGNYTYVSPSVKQLLGFEPEELINISSFSLIHPNDAEAILNGPRQEVLNGSTVNHSQFRLRKKDNNYIWVEAYTKPIADEEGNVYQVQTSARDISSRKFIENKLKESERKYKLISNNSEDLISLYTSEENPIRTYISPSCKKIMGYEPEEMIGRSPYDFILSEDAEKMKENIHPITLSGKTAIAQYRAMRKDGTIIWLESISNPSFNEENKIIGFQTSARDITQRKKYEQEIISAKEKAEEATKAKSQFLSMMSHEIRTPMNAIIGLTNLLLEEKPNPIQIESLNLLKFSGENLLTIINDILDFSKIEAGKIVLEYNDFNLHALMVQTTEMLRPRATQKGLEFNFVYEDSAIKFLKGDQVRINQIVTNLVSNAIKFTEKGSVELVVTPRSNHNGNNEIQFIIKDTGIGIPQDKIDTVFESFSQASSDITRKFGGTGLGLSISRQLLKLMGSDMSVKSQIDKGSEFSFTLSLKSGEIKNEDKKQVKNGNPLFQHPTNILLVEDNRVNQIVASRFLKKWGASIDTANNGIEALELIASKKYQLILMDLEMPEMDGYETSIKIRSQSDLYFKNIPIIALTASAMVEIKAKSLSVGMNDYISKPFQPDELFEKISLYTNSNIDIPFDTNISLKPSDIYANAVPSLKKVLTDLLIRKITELQNSLDNPDSFESTKTDALVTLSLLGDVEYEKVINSIDFGLRKTQSEKLKQNIDLLNKTSAKLIENLKENLKEL